MIQLKNEIEEIRIFIKNKKCGLFLMTVVLSLIYGIRAVHDNFYIDSEIMFQKPGLFCLVLSWGVYQVYVPLYITLVLVSFVLVYLNGNPERTFEYGVRHILLFFIGCLTYMILVKAVRIAVHTDSTYVSDLIHWKTEGIAAGIQAVITTMMRAAIGHGVFYQKWYAPAMLLFCIQCMYLGWKKKKSLVDYGIFLISGILLVLSPFYLTILSGAVQSVRTEMVYPVAAALFLAHLTVWPENGRKWEKWKTAAISLVCVVCIIQQGAVTLQLFQSSLEAYRNDVLTMTQMYPKICEAAYTEDMSQCKVIFLGKKSADLHGPVVYGELCGHSFFEPEATSALGVTGRVAPVFGILGMDMQAIGEEEKELYDQAVLLMEEAPSWPGKGSIQKLDENVVAVKLSGDRF